MIYNIAMLLSGTALVITGAGSPTLSGIMIGVSMVSQLFCTMYKVGKED